MYRFKGLQNVYSTIVDLSKITFCWWHFLFYPSPLSSQLELSIDGIYTKRLKVKQFWSKIFCSQSSFHSFSSSSADKPHLVLLYCQWKIKTCLCLIDVFVLWLVFVGVVSPFTTGLSQMNHHFFLFFPHQNNYIHVESSPLCYCKICHKDWKHDRRVYQWMIPNVGLH